VVNSYLFWDLENLKLYVPNENQTTAAVKLEK